MGYSRAHWVIKGMTSACCAVHIQVMERHSSPCTEENSCWRLRSSGEACEGEEGRRASLHHFQHTLCTSLKPGQSLALIKWVPWGWTVLCKGDSNMWNSYFLLPPSPAFPSLDSLWIWPVGFLLWLRQNSDPLQQWISRCYCYGHNSKHLSEELGPDWKTNRAFPPFLKLLQLQCYCKPLMLEASTGVVSVVIFRLPPFPSLENGLLCAPCLLEGCSLRPKQGNSNSSLAVSPTPDPVA